MLNRYTKVKIQCPRRPRSKVASSSPAQHRTIPHTLGDSSSEAETGGEDPVGIQGDPDDFFASLS